MLGTCVTHESLALTHRATLMQSRTVFGSVDRSVKARGVSNPWPSYGCFRFMYASTHTRVSVAPQLLAASANHSPPAHPSNAQSESFVGPPSPSADICARNSAT